MDRKAFMHIKRYSAAALSSRLKKTLKSKLAEAIKREWNDPKYIKRMKDRSEERCLNDAIEAACMVIERIRAASTVGDWEVAYRLIRYCAVAWARYPQAANFYILTSFLARARCEVRGRELLSSHMHELLAARALCVSQHILPKKGYTNTTLFSNFFVTDGS